MLATRKAHSKFLVAATTKPVTIGAAIPEIWLLKFIMPPTVPTLSRGAIKPGIDQPTGAAIERPVMESVIQKRADGAACEYATPKIPSPSAVPPTRMVRRTRVAFQPRWISESTSQPPTISSATVALNHGTAV